MEPTSSIRNPQSAIRNPAKPVLGVLGGIGSGKSEVARLLAARGGKVIVADHLGHEALRQPEIKNAVVARWGPELLDGNGQVVRPRLGAIVFADREQLKALEALTHPWIGRRIREEIAAARLDPAVRFIVLDAALLLEAGWHDVCDTLIYVDTPRDVRLARLGATRGWTEAELERRERAQMPLTQKAGFADHTLTNSGTPEQLAHQVGTLLTGMGLA